MTSLPRFAILTLAAVSTFTLSGCGSHKDTRSQMIVSVHDQQMLLVRDHKPVKVYPVSTSKYGLGDRPGSNCTPLGRLEVARKIGDHAPKGAVFKRRRPTGEVLKPNAPGRDPIVTRIIWLRGTEQNNRHAYRRCIYIHGTPEEWRLGQPASYGCIRMASGDIVDLYRRIGHGAEVRVIRGPLIAHAEGQQLVLAGTRKGRPGA
jgi:lipoprotein-anchoring transpeptidase ErfK/SrfK